MILLKTTIQHPVYNIDHILADELILKFESLRRKICPKWYLVDKLGGENVLKKLHKIFSIKICKHDKVLSLAHQELDMERVEKVWKKMFMKVFVSKNPY